MSNTSHTSDTDYTAYKIQKRVNKKVLNDMQKAVNEIHQEEIKNQRFAFKGMAIVFILTLFLSYLFF